MGDGVPDLHAVLDLLGRDRPSEAPVDRGSPGRTHVFIVDDLVVKCDDRIGSSSMRREQSALELLDGCGLPVPEFVAAGEFDDSRRWIALTRLDGEPPPDAARPAHELSADLAAQLGTVAAQLHAAARPPGFGTWVNGPRSMADEERLRCEALMKMARAAELVPTAVLDRMEAAARLTVEAVVDCREPVLAHRDLQPRNVLVDRAGRLTALLDFESSCGGDPAEDFKVIGLDWTATGYHAFVAAYGAAGGDLGPDGPDRIAHHVLNWVLVVVAYVAGVAPGYVDPAMTAFERIVSGERPRVPEGGRPG